MLTPSLHCYFSEETRGYIIKKDELIGTLVGEAQRSGIEIAAGRRVTGISSRGAKGYGLRTDRGELKCQLLVDCSGHRSPVRSFLGLSQIPTAGAVIHHLSADEFDASWLGSGSRPGRRYASFLFDRENIPGGYAWTFPMGDTVQLGAVSVENPARCLDRLLHIHGLELPRVPDTVGGRIPSGGLVDRLVHGRVLLLGDAAGAVNPVNFAGNYGAMLSASFAAETICEYFKKCKNHKGDCTADLERYERRMKEHPSQSPALAAGARALYSLGNRTLDLMGRSAGREGGLSLARMGAGLLISPGLYGEIGKLLRVRRTMPYLLADGW